MIVNLVAESQHKGLRLDQFLVINLPELSRSQIISSIRDKLILIDGSHKKSSYRLKGGEQISGSVLNQTEITLKAEKVDFRILFEDDSILLISKPPGLVVHPGNGNSSGTLANGLLHYCDALKGIGEDQLRPGIVHRLDKDTSGIMVVAKNAAAHRALVSIFKNHDLEKVYLALVDGVPAENHGRIATNIGRHPVNRQKMAVRDVGGKFAVTNWELLETFQGRYSLLRVLIETGRTHQIRVHMAYLGMPVAGDSVYGKKTSSVNFPRQMLHAWRLKFPHPEKNRVVAEEAELWGDFQKILNCLRKQEEAKQC